MIGAAAVLFAVFSLAAAPEPGMLSDPKAKALFAEAQGAFEQNDFALAAKKIEAAYLVEPNDNLLYPWAQAERSQGNCDVAVELYRQFLATGPDQAFAEAAQQNIDRCEAGEDAEGEELLVVEEAEDETEGEDSYEDALADEAEPDPKPDPPPPPKKDDDQEKPRAWYKDPAGGVLFGLGIVGSGVGGGLIGAGVSMAKKADGADTAQGYEDEKSRATGLRNGGLAALSIGGALLVGGIIRYAVVAKKNKQQTASLLMDPEKGTFGVSWVGRF